MKRFNQRSFSFLLALCLASCGSNNNIEVSGTVVEYGTSSPISSAKIIIIGGMTTEPFESPIEFFIDSIFTDQDGFYSWSDKNATSADYFSIASVQKENYFDINTQIPISENIEEIVLDPFAWLDIKATDDPSIPGDYCKTAATFIQPNLIGEFNELYNLRGNRDVYIKTKKEVGVSFTTDTLFILGLDTLFYEIKY